MRKTAQVGNNGTLEYECICTENDQCEAYRYVNYIQYEAKRAQI